MYNDTASVGSVPQGICDLSSCWDRKKVIMSLETPPESYHNELKQNGWCFADDIFICILNEKLFQISLKLAPVGTIDNKLALVQVMACRRTGDKPLPEPMLTTMSDAIYGDYRSQWVNLNVVAQYG